MVNFRLHLGIGRCTTRAQDDADGEGEFMQNVVGSDAWRDDAVCKGTYGYPFYSQKPLEREGRPEKRQREQQAKRVCARCPVCAQCLAWAINHDEMSGVWGGTTEMERRALMRRTRLQTNSQQAS
jgi:WhiB family redox-sensing transcriptional regulator